MRVSIEVFEKADHVTVSAEVKVNEWLDQKRNKFDKREGILESVNAMLRALDLEQITW